MVLSSIGICRGRLSEVIVTTYHNDGAPNAAPMGVLGLGGDNILLRVHRDTDTFENIRREGCCVVNVVFDPLLFLRCALVGRHKGSKVVETLDVLRAKVVSAPYIKGTNTYVEAELLSCEYVNSRDSFGPASVAKLTLKAVNIVVLSPFPVAPNRGLFAAIEIAVSLSRGMEKDVQGYLEVVKKTLPPEESEAVVDFVNSFVG
ncbi:MAG: DUF447 domain-containing protein [Candidatus Hydrothermarchaeales archaeon]